MKRKPPPKKVEPVEMFPDLPATKLVRKRRDDLLTNVAYAVLRRMQLKDATIIATRTFPFPHKYVVKESAHETGNVETNANIVSSLVEAGCIDVVEHDEKFDRIVYAISEKGERLANNGGEL